MFVLLKTCWPVQHKNCSNSEQPVLSFTITLSVIPNFPPALQWAHGGGIVGLVPTHSFHFTWSSRKHKLAYIIYVFYCINIDFICNFLTENEKNRAEHLPGILQGIRSSQVLAAGLIKG